MHNSKNSQSSNEPKILLNKLSITVTPAAVGVGVETDPVSFGPSSRILGIRPGSSPQDHVPLPHRSDADILDRHFSLTRTVAHFQDLPDVRLLAPLFVAVTSVHSRRKDQLLHELAPVLSGQIGGGLQGQLFQESGQEELRLGRGHGRGVG